MEVIEEKFAHELMSFMNRLISILKMVDQLNFKVVSKIKLSKSDYERFIQLQLSDLVSTNEVNPFLQLIIEQVEAIANSPEVHKILSEIEERVFTNQERSNFNGLSSLRKAVTEVEKSKQCDLVRRGCEAIRKDILRVDMFEVVPLLIKTNAVGAAIVLCIHKAHESENLDTMTECGAIIREIILAIDDCIRGKAVFDSEISRLIKKCVDGLTCENKALLFKKSLD